MPTPPAPPMPDKSVVDPAKIKLVTDILSKIDLNKNAQSLTLDWIQLGGEVYPKLDIQFHD